MKIHKPKTIKEAIDDCQEFLECDLYSRFRPVQTLPIEKNGSIKQDSFIGDLATLESLTRKIYRVINKGRSVNKFKEFWIEEKEED